MNTRRRHTYWEIWLRGIFLVLLFPLALTLVAQTGIGNIPITVTTTSAKCPNDGTMTIVLDATDPDYSHYVSTSWIYELVPLDGQTVTPAQSSNVFSSLFPGRYKVKVRGQRKDNSTEEYIYPTPYSIANEHTPFEKIEAKLSETYGAYPCPSPQGKITLTIVGGRLPFTFTIQSPKDAAPQAVTPTLTTEGKIHTAVFSNLENGEHTIVVRDACLAGSTTKVQLKSPGLPFPKQIADNPMPAQFSSYPECGVLLELYSSLIENNPKIKAQFDAGNVEVGIAPKGKVPTAWVAWNVNQYNNYTALPFGTYKSSDFWGKWSAAETPAEFEQLIKNEPSATFYVRLKDCPNEPILQKDFYVPLPSSRIRPKYLCDNVKLSVGIYTDEKAMFCYPVRTYIVPYDETSSKNGTYADLESIALTNDKGNKYYEITRPLQNFGGVEPNGGFDADTWTTTIDYGQRVDAVLVDASGKQVVFRHARSYKKNSGPLVYGRIIENWEKEERRGCNTFIRRFHLSVDSPDEGRLCEDRLVKVYDITGLSESEYHDINKGTFLWEETLSRLGNNAATQAFGYEAGKRYRVDFYRIGEPRPIAQRVDLYPSNPNPTGFIFKASASNIQTCQPHTSNILEVFTRHMYEQGNLGDEIIITGPGLSEPLKGTFKTRFGEHHRDWRVSISLSPTNRTLQPGVYNVLYKGPCGEQNFQVVHPGISRANGFKATPVQTCDGMTLKVEGVVQYYEVNHNGEFVVTSEGYINKPGNTFYRIIKGPAGFDSKPLPYQDGGTIFKATTPGEYTIAIGATAGLSETCNFGVLKINVGAPKAVDFDALATQGFFCSGQTKGTITAMAKFGTPPYKYELLDKDQNPLSVAGVPHQTLEANKLAIFSHGNLHDVYFITVTDACGTVKTLRVEVKPVNEMIPFYEDRLTICQDEDYTLTPRPFPDGTTYRWTHKTHPTASVETEVSTEHQLSFSRATLDKTGIYTFTAQLPYGGCSISKSFELNVVRCYLRTNRHISSKLK